MLKYNQLSTFSPRNNSTSNTGGSMPSASSSTEISTPRFGDKYTCVVSAAAVIAIDICVLFFLYNKISSQTLKKEHVKKQQQSIQPVKLPKRHKLF